MNPMQLPLDPNATDDSKMIEDQKQYIKISWLFNPKLKKAFGKKV